MAIEKALGEAVRALASGASWQEVGRVLGVAEAAESDRDVIEAFAETKRAVWSRFWGSSQKCRQVGTSPAVGLPRGTVDRPLAVVLVSPTSSRALFAGLAFRDHRDGKARRTFAGGRGWAAKGVAYLVCARCRSLH